MCAPVVYPTDAAVLLRLRRCYRVREQQCSAGSPLGAKETGAEKSSAPGEKIAGIDRLLLQLHCQPPSTAVLSSVSTADPLVFFSQAVSSLLPSAITSLPTASFNSIEASALSLSSVVALLRSPVTTHREAVALCTFAMSTVGDDDDEQRYAWKALLSKAGIVVRGVEETVIARCIVLRQSCP